MKLCIDCKHCLRGQWCRAPENGISVLDGKPNVYFAVVSRKDDKQCGVDARFFEPKDPEPQNHRRWWKFWRV